MKVETLRREKISERDERLLKVNQLKDKIRDELKNIRISELHILSTLNTSILNDELYKNCILTLTALFAIEDFIDIPDTFMQEDSIYADEDVVIYTIHMYYIDIMLSDSFNFCQRILVRLASHGMYYFLGDILNERNLIPSIISIFDELEYDSKKARKGILI